MVKAVRQSQAGEPQPNHVTESAVLGGRLTLSQPRHGYRAGLDAALLAAAVDLRPGERGLEAGCGVGGALLQVAIRCPGARLVGVERNADALALAQANLAGNSLVDRVEARGGDVGAGFAALAVERFDAAFCNPPFFDDPSSLRAPDPSRREAYMADHGLEAWVTFLLKAVRDGGRVTLIHRADRLADLLASLTAGGGSIRIRPVQPFADEPAKRVLVRAIRGGRAPLSLLPALVLHDRSGAKHTPEAEAILRGETALGWA